MSEITSRSRSSNNEKKFERIASGARVEMASVRDLLQPPTWPPRYRCSNNITFDLCAPNTNIPTSEKMKKRQPYQAAATSDITTNRGRQLA